MARWQYGEGKYLSTVSINRNAVSSGPSVDALRDALGFGKGMFDQYVRNAVIDRQRELGLEVTGVVTEKDWDAIVNGAVEAEEPAEVPEPQPKARKPRKPRASRARATTKDE